MRAVAGRPIVWRFELDDQDGVPIDADEDTNVVVDVLAGDGSTIELGGFATDDPIVGAYSFTIAAQTKLDTLAVTATATVGGHTQTYADTIRVVSARLLTPADIRADANLTTLASNNRRVLAQVLDAVEDTFSDALGFPAAQEGARINFDARRGTFEEAFAYGDVQASVFTGIPGLGFGFGGERLVIPGVSRPQQVYAMTINGNTVVDDVISQFAPGNGYLIWTGGRSWPSANYQIWLSHGLRYIPGDLRQAAATLAGYYAKRTPKGSGQSSLLPERTASLTTEGATIVFAIPTPDRPTGLPEVDAVLFRYSEDSVI